MTLWLPRRIKSVQVSLLLYPGQSESLQRTNGLDRLTDKIKQRMKCLSPVQCTLLHVVTSYIKSDAPSAVGLPCQILNELSYLLWFKWVPPPQGN